jgi:hypothetical protein
MSPDSDRETTPRISADRAAVAVAAVLVLLAALGLLPTITFLVK